jgi:ATP-dependent Lhr-like helicase
MPLSGFHPLVRDGFASRFAAPTPAQEQAWPLLRAGRDVLLSAPAGSGKTLAALLAAIDTLTRRAIEGTLDARCSILYVSPLKALGGRFVSGFVGEQFALPAVAEELRHLARRSEAGVAGGAASSLDIRALAGLPGAAGLPA